MAANSLRCAIPPSNGKFLELDVVLSSLHRMLMMNLNVRIRRKDSAIRRGGVQRAKLRPRQPWWGNRSASPATSLPDALMRSLTVENWQDLFALLRRGKNTRSFQSPSLVHMQMEKAAFFCWSALHEEKKKKKTIFDHHMVQMRKDSWLSGISRALCPAALTSPQMHYAHHSI